MTTQMMTNATTTDMTTQQPETARIVTDFPALAGNYDALILDIWGVLYDGAALYDGIVDTLKLLRERGQPVCLLSNSPHRADGIVEKLAGFGVSPDLYDGIMTSGESAHTALRERDCPDHAALGRKYFALDEERSDILFGLDLELVDTPEDGEFLFNTSLIYDVGDRGRELAEEKYGETLKRCLDAGLDMICANPDLVVNTGPVLSACSGMAAEVYKDMGGKVIYHGKPHAPVYDRVLKILGHPDKSRVLAVGDGLHTDIAGANAQGIDCLFITAGIHGHEVLDAPGRINPERLATLLSKSPHNPDYVAPGIGLERS